MGTNKLAPPLLEGTLPAFYTDNKGIFFNIPFSMNRAVSAASVKGFAIKIKTIQSGEELIISTITDPLKVQQYLSNFLISFGIEKDSRLNVGQFYKIQIAYIDIDGAIGFYSSIGVAKYTQQPSISIKSLDEMDTSNSHLHHYTGVFNHAGDKSEYAYSYRFDLYDTDGETVLYSSGDKLHASDGDELEESTDTYIFPQDLRAGVAHYVQYHVTTVNGLQGSSPRYRIIQKPSVNPEIKANLLAELNYEEGYISLALEAIGDNINDVELATGSFVITRSNELTDYMIWDEIYRFQLTAQIPNLKLFKDFTIEQGQTYKYAIQQYNDNGLYSNRIISISVYADFEHSFLYDGEKQLKIKYNPKISSFKKNILETKTDTIGGKYPFIFRNSRVSYSEFPISGLISYQMDEENLFLSEKEYSLSEKTTNLVSDNISSERLFKMKVLEWLTNGKPKIFRSPTEGNFIVRLMNSSLTPNDTLGRMLHSFSCTAYEVADFNYDTMVNMNFINLENHINTAMRWETMTAWNKEQFEDGLGYFTLSPSNGYPIRTLRINDMYPGEMIYIKYKGEDNECPIKIGVTGSYAIDSEVDIESVRISQSPSFGSITYGYLYNQPNVFNTIKSVDIEEVPARQFIGECDILKNILYVQDKWGDWFKNPKVELTKIYRIDVQKRPLERVQHNNNNSALNDPQVIYALGNFREEPGYAPNKPNEIFDLGSYYDGYNEKYYTNVYNPSIVIDGKEISVNEIEAKTFINPDIPTTLTSTFGVITTVSYQICCIDYQIEDRADTEGWLFDLRIAKNSYNKAKANLEAYYQTVADESSSLEDSDYATEQVLRDKLLKAYNDYIVTLVQAQKEDIVRKGANLND